MLLMRLPLQFVICTWEGVISTSGARRNPGISRFARDDIKIMYHYLTGKIVEKNPASVILDVNGVGYAIQIPISTFTSLPELGQSVRILTHFIVREDAHLLFGFMTADERDLFKLLVQHVSGIGPKTALGVLNGISVVAFKGAVVNNDTKTLSQIKGIGKKTAERIILDLKDRIGVVGAWEAASAKHTLSAEDQKINDAVLALISLGYKQTDAHQVIRKTAEKLGDSANVEKLVREALRQV